MAIPTLVELAESGAHFGHHKSLTYPKAKDFVYTIKSNVALINLEKTQDAIERAQKLITECQKDGKSVLFVGTKRSIRDTVKEAAQSIGAAYITERWFGGTLTNFATIEESIKRMNELEEFLNSPKAEKISKKDRLTRARRLARYHRFLEGLKTLKGMPDLIVLASASEDAIAIEEANQLDIPVLAITDTDMNPERVTYPIPANDDAPKAVELILRAIVGMSAPKKATEVKEDTEEVAAETEPAEKPVAKKVAKKTAAKAEKKPVAKKAEKVVAKKEVKKPAAKKTAAKKTTPKKTAKGKK